MRKIFLLLTVISLSFMTAFPQNIPDNHQEHECCEQLGGCSSVHRVGGWYPVDDSNKIEGEAIVTTADFESVTLDTLTSTEVAFIEGRLKQDRIADWTDATERRITYEIRPGASDTAADAEAGDRNNPLQISYVSSNQILPQSDGEIIGF